MAEPDPKDDKNTNVAIKRLTRAARFLIESENYKEMRNNIISLIARGKRVPLRFTGKLEVLNPLVELGVSDPVKFDLVMGEVAQRRYEMHYEAEVVRQYSRRDYMRDYMRTYRAKRKRARQYPPSQRDLSDDIGRVLTKK